MGCFVGELLLAGFAEGDCGGDTVGAAALGCFVGELIATVIQWG